MAETSTPPLLLPQTTSAEEEEPGREPDQQPLCSPFFSRRNINDVILFDYWSTCLDTLYDHISCSSDCDSDEESYLKDLVMGDLSFSSQEDEFSMTDEQISNSAAFQEELKDERLGFVTTVQGDSSTSGLRVAGIDSESDSELVNEDEDDREEQAGGALFWDCLGFEEQMSNNGELDWEEIEDNERGLRSVIDRIEEISVSSSLSRYEEMNEIPGEEEEEEAVAESLEWEDLVEMVNWDRPRMHDFEALDNDIDEEYDDDNDSYLAIQDNYTTDGGENLTEFIHQFTRDNSILRGSPPTSEYAKKNLPCLVLTEEELKQNLVCAVCKDNMVVDEKVTMLPCNHHYHCECIFPWLNVRNTCPLCRYELPTDDLDYELRRVREGDVVGLGGGDSEDGYNYEWLV